MPPLARFALGVALLLGLLVRLLPVIGAAGATGDGGLFFAMVEDVRHAGLSVPGTTSYNHLGIPFLYPPLALIAGAVVGDTTGLPTMELLRWMPLTFSVLSLAAFAWVTVRLLPPTGAVIATFMYALMPHAYDWVIAGGGLTRGLGLFFALLAIGIAAKGSGWNRAAIAGLLLGLSVLSHPQAPIFGLVGALIFSYRRPVAGWARDVAIAGATALLVGLVWLVPAVATHGIDAFLGLSGRLEPVTGLIRLFNLEFAGAPFMNTFAVLGTVGLIVSIASRQWRLALLLVATYLIGAGGGEYLGAVAWSLLGGLGGGAVANVVVHATEDLAPRPRHLLFGGIAAGMIFLSLIGSLGSFADKSSKLQALTGEQIAAMDWLASSAPSDARVIVPTSDVWGDDEMSEWLPGLARRTSIGTVQGTEWSTSLTDQYENHLKIRSCAGSKATCYQEIDPQAWIFVPKGKLAGPFSPADCCPALRQTLPDADYEIVYDGPGATIARPEG